MRIDNFNILMKMQNSPNISSSENDIKLREQTDKFEAVFVKEILDISTKSESSLFPKSAGEDIYKSMYNDAMSNELSGKFGFSELLFNYLKERG